MDIIFYFSVKILIGQFISDLVKWGFLKVSTAGELSFSSASNYFVPPTPPANEQFLHYII